MSEIDERYSFRIFIPLYSFIGPSDPRYYTNWTRYAPLELPYRLS